MCSLEQCNNQLTVDKHDFQILEWLLKILSMVDVPFMEVYSWSLEVLGEWM